LARKIRRPSVNSRPYVAPAIETIGEVAELTQLDKCGGSGDQFLPQILSTTFGDPCKH
jgi:hypothetical protein